MCNLQIQKLGFACLRVPFPTQPGSAAFCGGRIIAGCGRVTAQAKLKAEKGKRTTSPHYFPRSLHCWPPGLWSGIHYCCCCSWWLLSCWWRKHYPLERNRKKKSRGWASLHSRLFLPHNNQGSLLEGIKEVLFWVSHSLVMLMITRQFWDRHVTSLIPRTSLSPSLLSISESRKAKCVFVCFCEALGDRVDKWIITYNKPSLPLLKSRENLSLSRASTVPHYPPLV